MYIDMGKKLDSAFCSDEIVVFFFMFIEMEKVREHFTFWRNCSFFYVYRHGKILESTFCPDEIVVFSLCI